MIARIDIESDGPRAFSYRVSVEQQALYDDTGLASMAEALVAAVEGLPPDAAAVELAYQAIVSGTYPLEVLAMNVAQVAEHTANTTDAVQEALAGR
jgi:ADP-ribosylglycohydrolase